MLEGGKLNVDVAATRILTLVSFLSVVQLAVCFSNLLKVLAVFRF